MLILHTSDTHLGYAQFDLEEREKDVYDAFSEIVDAAVKDRVNQDDAGTRNQVLLHAW